jgi:hypothetical protein
MRRTPPRQISRTDHKWGKAEHLTRAKADTVKGLHPLLAELRRECEIVPELLCVCIKWAFTDLGIHKPEFADRSYLPQPDMHAS